MPSGWSDWRTDTAERAPLPAVPSDGRDDLLPAYVGTDAARVGGTSDETSDATRTLPPVRVPAEPTGDLPRPPRWPLYADDPTSGPTATATRLAPVPGAAPAPGRGLASRPLLPWVAAAMAVALAAGTGVFLGSRPDPVITTSSVSLDGADAGEQQGSRSPGASRGESRADEPGPRSGREGGTAPESDAEEERDTRAGGGGRAGDGDRGDAPNAAARARREAESVTGLATATAPSTAPPNEDLAGRTVSYAAPNMLDGRDETAWRMVGDGQGTVLTFTFAQPVTLTTVGLLNGYAKTGSTGGRTVDWYAGNRRVRQVEWYFDDGSRVVHSLDDVAQVQSTDIKPRTTTTLRLRLTRVSGPGGGPDRRDYTAISEVALEGVPRQDRD